MLRSVASLASPRTCPGLPATSATPTALLSFGSMTLCSPHDAHTRTSRLPGAAVSGRRFFPPSRFCCFFAPVSVVCCAGAAPLPADACFLSHTLRFIFSFLLHHFCCAPAAVRCSAEERHAGLPRVCGGARGSFPALFPSLRRCSATGPQVCSPRFSPSVSSNMSISLAVRVWCVPRVSAPTAA
jgi:hypothetical protein